MPVSCEVCGSCSAKAVLTLCVACKPGRQAGCHTFCLPGPQHSIKSMAHTFTCLACSSTGHARRERAANRTAPGARAGTAASARPTAGTQPAHARRAAAQGAGAAGGAKAAAIPHAGPSTAAPAHKKGAAASSLVDWSQLPSEVLSVILQLIPQRHRFSSCLLVSTAWAAATAAGTRSLSIERRSAVELQRAWAGCAPSYASQLTQLSLATGYKWAGYWYGSSLSPDAPCLLHLPCARIRALEVSGAAVQLTSAPALNPDAPDSRTRAAQPAGPSLPGLLDTATGLTRLCLLSVELAGRPEEQLSAVTALKELQQLSLTVHGQQPAPFDNQVQMPPPLLPDSFIPQLGQLTKLTSLYLATKARRLWSGPGSHQISRLTALQRLSLAAGEGHWWSSDPDLFPEPADGLQHLTALTSLELTSFKGSAIPDLRALSALQRVVLHGCRQFDPSPLLGLTAIAHLEVLTQGQPGGAEQTMRRLLSVLQRQQQLTHLQLDTFMKEAAPAEFAALTTSSKLRTLRLTGLNMPAGALQHLFKPERPLQHLTCLQLAGQKLAQTSAGELLLLVQACPTLQQLSLRTPLNSYSSESLGDLQLGLLSGLARLTQLTVAGAADGQLKQLRGLSMPGSCFSFECVQGLTAMQQGSTPVHKQLQQRWRWCIRRWEEAEERRKQKESGVLLQMGVPLEGYPTGPHGRALRSSRAAKPQ